MKLHIKNYGPIKKCVLDLSKRYYLFVGYNNSGKTYLAKLLYEVSIKDNLDKFFESDYCEIPQKEFQETITIDIDFLKNLLQKYALFIKEVVLLDALQIQSDSKFILENLELEFEVNQEMIKTGDFLKAKWIYPTDYTKHRPTLIKLKKNNSMEFAIEFMNKESFLEISGNNHIEYDNFVIREKEFFFKNLYQDLLQDLTNVEKENYFLPANRLFLLENADELFQQQLKKIKNNSDLFIEMINKMGEDRKVPFHLLEQMKNFEQQYPNKHTKHLLSLMESIVELRQHKNEDYLQNGTGQYNDFLEKLSAIMGGEVINHKISDLSYSYERFKIKNGNADKSLRLYLASSSVNQLSVLYLYFKYWASESGNLLIIDEPEENLHPKSQIALFTLLLEFASVNANRVVITTHSPLLAEVMNNYLVLGQLENKTEMAEKLGLSDIDLNPENTGIYAFNGSVVHEYTVGDYGTIFTTFKEAQDTVYRLGEVLDDEMYKQKNKNNP